MQNLDSIYVMHVALNNVDIKIPKKTNKIVKENSSNDILMKI